MLETLIAAGGAGLGSLISGLGARQSAKSQQRHQEEYDKLARERSLTNFQKWRDLTPRWLVEDADKAGFNPVTWLNAGALGHYDNMFNSYGSVAGQATQAISIPSVMSAVGGAISSAFSSFDSGRRFDAKMAFEQSALDQTLNAQAARYGAIPTQGTSLLGGTNGPIYSAGGRTERHTPQLSTWDAGYKPYINTGPSKDDAPHQIERDLKPDPHLPSAQAVENEYGDVASWVYGVGKLGFDTYHSLAGSSGYSAIRDYGRGVVRDLTAPFGSSKFEKSIRPFFSNPGNVPAIGMGM